MDSSLRLAVLLSVQPLRAFSDAKKTTKSSDSLGSMRLDRFPAEILLNILSHLLDHNEFFAKTCIKYSRIAHVKNSIRMIPNETIDLRNTAVVCRHMMPVAQELLFHTICIDDQKRGPTQSASIISMMGMVFRNRSRGLLPFSQSKLFKFIRLLIDTPHLRSHVKQLHISLSACQYSNGQKAAIEKLDDDFVSALDPEVDGTGPTRPGALVPAKSHFLPFAPLDTLFRRWGSQKDYEIAMSNEELSLWLRALLVLLPNLQSLRLWDIHSGVTEFESWAEVHRKTEPLPRLIRTCLSSPLIPFDNLRYISIPVYGNSGIFILHNLPNVKTAELSLFLGRAAPETLPFWKKISHVDNLRFPFSDLGSDAGDTLHAMACVLMLFENVRSIEVYDGVDDDMHRWFYNPWLLNMFSNLTPAIMPHRETLETLHYAGQFSYSEDYYCSFPNLAAFGQLKTLSIPQQLIFDMDRTFMDQPPFTGPYWTYSRLKLDYLPPNVESLTLDRCGKLVLMYLKVLVENEDKFPGLHQVDVIFNCREGMEMLAGQVDQNGYWKGAEGSRIKFRPIKDYWENTGLMAAVAALAASAGV